MNQLFNDIMVATAATTIVMTPLESITVAGASPRLRSQRVTAPRGFGSALSSFSVRDKFLQLAERWREATLFVSSTRDLLAHPLYLEIIGLGKPALPLVIAMMKEEPGMWFAAAKAISGEDPIRPADRGDIEAMSNAWLAWGEANGFIGESNENCRLVFRPGN